MAPKFLYQNGKLITRDAGAYTLGNFWSTWAKGSLRLRTPFNDIRPHNHLRARKNQPTAISFWIGLSQGFGALGLVVIAVIMLFIGWK